MKFKIARNIEEYLEIINQVKQNDEIWFRGMSSATHSLEPSLFREKRVIGLEYSGREINGKYYRKSEAIMKSDFAAIDEFTKYYRNAYPKKSKNYNLIDFLYIMQHYDIPTRLLDFSANALIALYFSVAKDKKEHEPIEDAEKEFLSKGGYTIKGSTVHCINPFFTNENTYGKREIINIDDVNDIDTLFQVDLPICIQTNNSDSRIKAKEGRFLFYGRTYRSYDNFELFNDKTTKIFIPNACRKQIKEELKEKYNTHHLTVYPDIKGISLEIIDSIENKYHDDCKNVFK